MATTYNWIISQLDCYPEEDGETDVVFIVHWRLEGTDGEYAGSVYSTQSVTIDPDVPFTPYPDLTEEQVVGWVKDAMGEEQVAACEANVAKQIEDQINPPVVSPPLPWATTEQ